jgi:sec-independent protein translocase protein TatB
VNAPGFWEIVFLAVLALLIFGPQRLPEVARGVGKAIAQFKREAGSTLDELKRAADYEEFEGVTRDLKQTTADLRRGVTLAGPVASSAGASSRRGPARTVEADAAAPFDPDAT